MAHCTLWSAVSVFGTTALSRLMYWYAAYRAVVRQLTFDTLCLHCVRSCSHKVCVHQQSVNVAVLLPRQCSCDVKMLVTSNTFLLGSVRDDTHQCCLCLVSRQPLVQYQRGAPHDAVVYCIYRTASHYALHGAYTNKTGFSATCMCDSVGAYSWWCYYSILQLNALRARFNATFASMTVPGSAVEECYCSAASYSTASLHARCTSVQCALHITRAKMQLSSTVCCDYCIYRPGVYGVEQDGRSTLHRKCTLCGTNCALYESCPTSRAVRLDTDD
eukprot:9698-Heterococcus_DN1.PRE.4